VVQHAGGHAADQDAPDLPAVGGTDDEQVCVLLLGDMVKRPGR
jgi:hypothetical protein